MRWGLHILEVELIIQRLRMIEWVEKLLVFFIKLINHWIKLDFFIWKECLYLFFAIL